MRGSDNPRRIGISLIAEEISQGRRRCQIHLRGKSQKCVVFHLLPDGTAQLIMGLTQKIQLFELIIGRRRLRCRIRRITGIRFALGEGRAFRRQAPEEVVDVVIHRGHDARNTNERRRQDRLRPRLIVERHVAARHGNAQLTGTIGKAMHGFTELPHDGGILRRTEVEAVGHRHRTSTRHNDVAVGLRQGQAGTHVRIELRVPSRRVRRHSNTTASGFVDTQYTGIGVLRLHRVPHDVAVVLLGDEGARTQCRGSNHAKPRLAQLVGTLRTGEALRLYTRFLQLILPIRALIGAIINGPLMGNRVCRRVHHNLAVVANDQMIAVRDLADLRAGHVPMGADLPEAINIFRGDDGTHALLGLRREDLGRSHVLRAQRYRVEVDLHATVPGRSQLGCGTGQSRTTQVLNTHDDPGVIQIQATFDEDLFSKGVPHLNRRQLPLGTIFESV